MADEKTTFRLDLDAKHFIEEAMHAKHKLAEIAEVEGLQELGKTFINLGKLAGVVGAAVMAMKVSLDLTVEAEQINKINSLFKELTTQAGISTHELEEGLKKVGAGLVDDTDLLKAANQAMIGMGESAKKLPDILMLARKATAVMGGDLLQNFEALNQAMATGQVKALKHFGITVDLAGAQAKLAKELGVTVGALTEAEKRQAIMNASIEAGQKRFAAVKLSTDSATSSLKILSATFNEIKETAILFFDRVFGDLTRASIKKFAETVQSVSQSFKQTFGTEADKAAGRMAYLRQEIKFSNQEIEKMQKMAAEDPRFKTADKQAMLTKGIAHYTDRVKTLTAELEKLGGVEKKSADDTLKSVEGSEAGKRQARKLTTEERAKNLMEEAKAMQMIEAANSARIKAEMEVETEASNMTRLFQEQKIGLQEQERAKLMELDAQRQLGVITEQTYQHLRLQTHAQTIAEIEALELKSNDAKIQAARNLANIQRQGAAGFAAGFKAASLEASRDVKNFSKLGEVAFNSLNKNAKNAFLAFGEGAQSAGEIMRGFMFNAIADIADAQGSEFLAAGIAGLNPAMLAAGGALLALAGFLRSQAKGTSAMTGAPGAGGGGAGAAPSLAGPDQGALTTAEEKKAKREVTIQIQGHYLDTEGSRRALMEMIRSETDATAFKYVEIGQGA